MKHSLRVTMPYATYILSIADGTVTSAPGAEWARGRDARETAAYFRRRGGRVEPLEGTGAFIRAACDAYDDQTAARLIEEHCRPPLPARLRRAPVVVPAGARSRWGEGTVAVTESAQSVTEPQDGVA